MKLSCTHIYTAHNLALHLLHSDASTSTPYTARVTLLRTHIYTALTRLHWLPCSAIRFILLVTTLHWFPSTHAHLQFTCALLYTHIHTVHTHMHAQLYCSQLHALVTLCRTHIHILHWTRPTLTHAHCIGYTLMHAHLHFTLHLFYRHARTSTLVILLCTPLLSRTPSSLTMSSLTNFFPHLLVYTMPTGPCSHSSVLAADHDPTCQQ